MTEDDYRKNREFFREAMQEFSDVDLTEVEMQRLLQASDRIGEVLLAHGKVLDLGETAPYLPDVEIEAKMLRKVWGCSLTHKTDDVPRELGTWLRNKLLKGDIQAIHRLALFGKAFHLRYGLNTEPQMPTFKDLGVKRPKGRPMAIRSPNCSEALFASAANGPVLIAMHTGRKPYYRRIMDELNNLRGGLQPRQGKIDKTEFSRLVLRFGLKGLLHTDKPGPRTQAPGVKSVEKKRLKRGELCSTDMT